MPKRKTYFTCKSCKSKHIKPIDDQCPFNVNVAENDNVSVVDNVDNAADGVDSVHGADVSLQDVNQMPINTDLGSQILSAIKTFNSRLTAMERRVHTNVNPVTCDPTKGATASAPAPMVNCSSQVQATALPSLSDLQASAQLQSRVDQRISHLDGLPDSNAQTPGKFKSQRGGKEVVFVKRQVPWPHNSIL